MALTEHELAAQAGSAGSSGARITTYNGISVDLRIVEPDAYGNLLQHFTGSAAAQRRPARARRAHGALGLRARRSLETESGEVGRYATEAEVYERLGLAYIEPELREGDGEIAAAAEGELPELVDPGRHPRRPALPHHALRRPQHARRDGRGERKARGYAYLAVTDHSASHGFGNHVTADQLLERVEEIEAYNASSQGRFRLLAGSEVNIGTDGSLDYDPEVLERLDWVVASVHTSFRISAKKMTERVIAAIENPHVDCIGHLTGRLIGRREPYEIDVEAVAAAAAEHGRCIEINGNPNRRDLSEAHARLAADAGVAIVVNTDAHGVDTLANMQLRDRDRAPRLADQGRHRQHADLEAAPEAARPDGVGRATTHDPRN